MTRSASRGACFLQTPSTQATGWHHVDRHFSSSSHGCSSAHASAARQTFDAGSHAAPPSGQHGTSPSSQLQTPPLHPGGGGSGGLPLHVIASAANPATSHRPHPIEVPSN